MYKNYVIPSYAESKFIFISLFDIGIPEKNKLWNFHGKFLYNNFSNMLSYKNNGFEASTALCANSTTSPRNQLDWGTLLRLSHLVTAV